MIVPYSYRHFSLINRTLAKIRPFALSFLNRVKDRIRVDTSEITFYGENDSSSGTFDASWSFSFHNSYVVELFVLIDHNRARVNLTALLVDEENVVRISHNTRSVEISKLQDGLQPLFEELLLEEFAESVWLRSLNLSLDELGVFVD